MMSVALPQPLQHQFTPDAAPRSLETIEPRFDALAAHPVDTEADLSAYLTAWNEFSCWIVQYASSTRIATVCDVSDADAKARWVEFLTDIMPKLASWSDALGKKLLASEALGSLEGTDYWEFVRQVRADVELFREENIPLGQELAELINQYNEISGAWSVEFDGKTLPMPAMTRYFADPDRQVREGAWRATQAVFASTSDDLETLFEKMFALRIQVAKNAGFDNFRDYIFAEKMRDYTPAECDAFAQLVAQEVVPLMGDLRKDLCQRLEIESCRPWDGSADPNGREPLNPFNTETELKAGVSRMFHRLDPELGEQFDGIAEHMDLASRDNKAPGGFMSWQPWVQRPYIFANATGVHGDIVTLLHEAGHAFHSLAGLARKPMSSMSVPMEFNEVASMAMELLAYTTLDEFYPAEEDRQQCIEEHLKRIPGLLVSIAIGDQFQHWMYTHPEHTRAERRAKWAALLDEYRPWTDWSGIDASVREDTYHRILHFFVVPFYFIEYGFAQLGALQIALNAEADLASAMTDYKASLALGPQKNVMGLYGAAGAQFVPTEARFAELMGWIRNQLLE